LSVPGVQFSLGGLLSERYDRLLTEIFALQDEIWQKIVFALKVKLTLEEQERFRRAPTNNLEVYNCYLRGLESFLRGFYETRKETNEPVRQMYEKAIELDPRYAGAYGQVTKKVKNGAWHHALVRVGFTVEVLDNGHNSNNQTRQRKKLLIRKRWIAT